MTEDAQALAELEAVQEASEGSLLGRINSNRSASGGSKPASPANSAANLAAVSSRKGVWAEAAKVRAQDCSQAGSRSVSGRTPRPASPQVICLDGSLMQIIGSRDPAG